MSKKPIESKKSTERRRWHLWLKHDGPEMNIYVDSEADTLSEVVSSIEPQLSAILDGTYIEGRIER